MRLTSDQVSSIVKVVRNTTPGPSKIFLYGSRTRDDLKGGDIDLCIVVPDSSTANSLNRDLARILAGIKTQIGDQRIDLSIITEQQKTSDEFWREALQSAVELVP